MPHLFKHHPGYVVLATLVLSVAIGVNLLVFTVANALWIRPLPFHEPERIVTIVDSSLGVGSLDGPLFRMFEGGVAGQVMTTDLFEGLRPRIEIAEVNRNIETLGVTPGYFKVLGLTVRGRDFMIQDDRDGAEPVAVISDLLWRNHFGRRAEVIGAILPTKPTPIRVIGVAPQGFEGARRGERADLWIPTRLVQRLAPGDWSGMPPSMMVFARLGHGQTPAAIEQRLHELMDPQSRAQLLKYLPTGLPRVVPLAEVFGTPESRTLLVREGNVLLVVSGLALLVLLGGCATIAALVLMHYERRRGELAIKMSLGIGRGRLIFELARDLSYVATPGVAGGMLVAALGVRVLPALNLPSGVIVGRLDLSLDWRVWLASIVAVVLTLALAAALPIARTTRPHLVCELLAAPLATLRSLRIRQSLLAIQVGSTIVVLIAAGLFVRAVMHGLGGATGFDVDRSVFVSVQEQSPRWRGKGPVLPFIEARAARLIAAVEQVPGVSEVAEGTAPIGADTLTDLSIPRSLRTQDQGREHETPFTILRGSPNLLSALGVPILAGRALSAADVTAPSPIPAVITSSLANRLWPASTALGKTFSIPSGRGGPHIVVGISGDIAVGSLMRPIRDAVIQVGPGNSTVQAHFVIRTDHPDIVASLVERQITGQIVHAVSGRELIARDISRQRLGAWFFSGFGMVALLLGVGGAFGLVAYVAESRRREFSVRLALGATMVDLVRHGLATALTPVITGVVIGLATGALASRVFAGFLVGISPLDGVTYFAVAVTMVGCAALAALSAAWRIRQTNPSDALRAI